MLYDSSLSAWSRDSSPHERRPLQAISLLRSPDEVLVYLVVSCRYPLLIAYVWSDATQRSPVATNYLGILLRKAQYSDNRRPGNHAPNGPLGTFKMSLYSAPFNKRRACTHGPDTLIPTTKIRIAVRSRSKQLLSPEPLRRTQFLILAKSAPNPTVRNNLSLGQIHNLGAGTDIELAEEALTVREMTAPEKRP